LTAASLLDVTGPTVVAIDDKYFRIPTAC